MWYVQTMKYYLAFKKKEILTHATTWIKLEDITPSEINQTQKNKYCTIPIKYGTRVVKFIETASSVVVARGGGGGEMRS